MHRSFEIPQLEPIQVDTSLETVTITHMGDDLLKRVERLEAEEQIRQLASRYALALDSRNMDDMVALFVEDVQVGRDHFGHAALREHFIRVLSPFTTSMHFVANHIIEFTDEDNAHGVVYCRAEHEDGDHWVIAALQYWDTYAHRNGSWQFVRRRLHSWYVTDVLNRPTGPGKYRWPGREQRNCTLPAIWPSWKKFWAALDNDNPPMG